MRGRVLVSVVSIAFFSVVACSSEGGTSIQAPYVGRGADASSPSAPDGGAQDAASTTDATEASDATDATDATDASDASDAAEARDAQTLDASGADAACDAGAFVTPPTCDKLGVTCPPDAPKCGVTYEASSNSTIYTCTESLALGGGLGEMCNPVVLGGCQDGLVCGALRGVGYRCTALCSADRDCPGEQPFCNVPWTWHSGIRNIRSCGQCNPLGTSECGFGKACRVKGATSEPSCEVAGTKALDEACTGAADCAPGLVCGCGGGGDVDAGATPFGIGDECAAKPDGGGGGTCRPTCADWSRGQTWDCPNGGTCVGEGEGLYGYCKL